MLPGLTSLLSRAEFRPGHYDYSLDAILKVMQFFDNPQDSIPCIHITGSNGKGSTSAFLASILGSAGFRVSLFSSPHFIRVNERIRIDGLPVIDEKLDNALVYILNAESKLNLSLSYFEMICAAFYLISRQERVDYAVVEVGLGGRLDATNIIKNPVCTAITTISLEHTAILGDNIEAIAKEKSGIIKHGSPCFVGRGIEQNAMNVIRQAAAAKNSQVIESAEQEVPQVELALAGAHQKSNARLACAIANFLDISEEAQGRGLTGVYWPGRLEKIELANGSHVILDAAHNIEGFQALREYLLEQNLYQITMLCAFLTSAPWQDMLALISEHVSKLFILQIDSFRSEDSAKVTSHAQKHFPKIEVRNFARNVQYACEHIAREQTPSIVAGSMYMLADVRKQLEIREKPVWRRRKTSGF